MIAEKLETLVVIAGLCALVTLLFVEGTGILRAGDFDRTPRAVSSAGLGLMYNHGR